ncbi:hypothetical protein D3C80_2138640 [compost metagenome]
MLRFNAVLLAGVPPPDSSRTFQSTLLAVSSFSSTRNEQLPFFCVVQSRVAVEAVLMPVVLPE